MAHSHWPERSSPDAQIDSNAWLERLKKFAENTAFIDASGRRIRYGALHTQALEFAAKLPKRHIAILEFRNDIASMIAYFGFMAATCPVILVAPGAASKDRRIDDQMKPAYLFDSSVGLTIRSEHLDHHVDLHPDLRVLLTTSGSTGVPKLVCLSETNIWGNARSIATYLDLNEGDRTVTTLPPNYSYGLSVINSHIYSGASVVLTDISVSEAAFWTIFDQFECSSFAGVPFSYQLLDRVGFFDRPKAGLRYLTQAGGRLDPSLAHKVADWASKNHSTFFIMYGQTEATARIAYLPPQLASSRSDCIGVAIPDGRIDLIDEAGKIVSEQGVAGEIRYYGPNVMMGYAEKIEELSFPTVLEHLNTGDIAVRDDGGIFKIVGRKSRFSKLFGLRINLDEVERHARELGFDADVAGDDDRIVIAFRNQPSNEATLRQAVAEKLGLPANSIITLKMDELPRLSNGKTDYRGILAAAATTTVEVGENIRILSREERTGILIKNLQGYFIGQRVSAGTRYEDLSSDSLNLLNCSMEIEKVLGFLPKGWESMTISELAALEPLTQRSKTLVRSDIVVRGIAAVLVVSAHAQGVSDKYKLHGAAFVLMMLSGYALFGMMKKDVWRSLTSSLTRLLAVYYAVVVLYFIAKRQISLPHFFLVSSYSDAASNKFAALTPLWFVETYTQVVIIFFTALYIFRHVVKNGDPRYFVLGFFGFACLLRLADLYWLRVGYPLQHTPFHLLMFLAMGLLVRCWIETKGSLLIPLLALAFVLYSIVESEVYARWDYISVLVFGFAMILLQIDLRLPPAAAQIPILIAVSSLEIYILHPFIIAALARVHPIGYVPSIILCVGLGVAAASVVKVIRKKVADLT